MTTVQITLPDALAREAAQEGLLVSGKIEQLLRESLRAVRIERMQEAFAQLDADPLPPVSMEEIQAEVKAVRAARRARAKRAVGA